MKRRSHVLAIALVAVLSVGFRYDTSAPAISSPYNVYLRDSLLLVSDSLHGLMIYSVADMQAPRFKTRIPLNGNRGMAMKDSIIYANSWGAILALRLVNDTDYAVTAVIKEDPRHMVMFRDGISPSYSGGLGCGTIPIAAGASSEVLSSGVGGSYAIFAVIDSFLYFINDWSIITMDISTPALPVKISETPVDWSIETLFPTEKYLFIGGKSGMYVMDRTDPAHPVMIGSCTHFRARDPVVVRDTVAYVTLRATFDSWGATDELMVVNLSAITNPKLIRELPLSTPYGLAVRDTLLFVAQGKNGWTLFGLSDPHTPAVLQHWAAPEAKDFIWSGDRLITMCLDEVKIYSVTDPGNPVLVSTIE